MIRETRSLCCSTLVAALVVVASPAFATRVFTVTPASSNLTVSNVSISHTVGGSFVTDLVPQGTTNFTRLVAGTIVADEVTGAVEFADLDLMGDSLLGDQILMDRRGKPRDIGDFEFIDLRAELLADPPVATPAGVNRSIGDSLTSMSDTFARLKVS